LYFFINLHIILGTVQENVSSCFYSEHSGSLYFLAETVAEPKTTLSRRWAKKWSRIFRLVSATAQSELLAQPRLSPKFGLSRGW